MRLLRKGKKRDKSIVDAAQIVTKQPTLPLTDRLTQFQESMADIYVNVAQIGLAGSSGGGGYVRIYHRSEIEPTTFVGMVSEEFGGGRYEVTFTSGGKTVMMAGSDSVPEMYHFSIAGKSKIAARKGARSDDDGPKKEPAPTGITSLKELGELFVVFQQFSTGNGNRMEEFKQMAEFFAGPSLVEELERLDKLKSFMTPPVQIGQGAAGMGGGFIDSVGRGIVNPAVDRVMLHLQGGVPQQGQAQQVAALHQDAPGGSPAAGAVQPLGAAASLTPEETQGPTPQVEFAPPRPLQELSAGIVAGMSAEEAAYDAYRLIAGWAYLYPDGVPQEWLNFRETANPAAARLANILPLGARDQQFQPEFMSRLVQHLKGSPADQEEQEERESESSNAISSDDIQGDAPERPEEPGQGGGPEATSSLDEGQNTPGENDG